jgi:peptide/nickel transport system permease protein
MLRRFLFTRILTGLLALLLFISAVFFMARILIPGDISSNFIQGTSGVQEEELMRVFGLDRPIWNQYLTWMGNILTLDLGRTGFRQSVLDQVLAALPWTLSMFALGIGLAFGVGLWVGRWAGWRKKATTPTTLGAAGLTSIFPPLLVFFTFYFSLHLFGWRFFNRMATLDFNLWLGDPRPHQVLWRMLLTLGSFALLAGVIIRLARHYPWKGNMARLLGLAVPAAAFWVWQSAGLLPRAIDLLGFLVLPVAALFVLVVGDVTLVVAASMDGLHEADFALTARAKGLANRMVRNHHAGRVAILPALARLTANLPFALGGLVIIEASFARLGGYRVPIPGLASVMFGSLRQRDVLLTLGGLVVVGVITLLLRIGLDVTTLVLDPRVKLESERHG